MPYTEDDADVFFGREADVRHDRRQPAKASRFGVLYGPSGVGKSSVLQAGVVRQIRDENRLRFERFGAVETVVAYVKEWRDDPYAALVGRGPARRSRPCWASAPFPERSADDDPATRSSRCGPSGAVDLLLILDQFEEFFLYHARPGRGRRRAPRPAHRAPGPDQHPGLDPRGRARAAGRVRGPTCPACSTTRCGSSTSTRGPPRPRSVEPLDHYNAIVPARAGQHRGRARRGAAQPAADRPGAGRLLEQASSGRRCGRRARDDVADRGAVPAAGADPAVGRGGEARLARCFGSRRCASSAAPRRSSASTSTG